MMITMVVVAMSMETVMTLEDLEARFKDLRS